MNTTINILDITASSYASFFKTLKYSLLPFLLFSCLLLSFFISGPILWIPLFLKTFLSYIFLHTILVQESSEVSFLEKKQIYKKHTLSLIKWQFIIKSAVFLFTGLITFELFWNSVFLNSVFPKYFSIEPFFALLVSSCIASFILLFASIKTFPFFVSLSLGKKMGLKKSYTLTNKNFFSICLVYSLVSFPVISLFSFVLTLLRPFAFTKLDLSLSILHFRVVPFVFSTDKIPLLSLILIISALLIILAGLFSCVQAKLYEALRYTQNEDFLRKAA